MTHIKSPRKGGYTAEADQPTKNTDMEMERNTNGKASHMNGSVSLGHLSSVGNTLGALTTTPALAATKGNSRSDSVLMVKTPTTILNKYKLNLKYEKGAGEPAVSPLTSPRRHTTGSDPLSVGVNVSLSGHELDKEKKCTFYVITVSIFSLTLRWVVKRRYSDFLQLMRGVDKGKQHIGDFPVRVPPFLKNTPVVVDARVKKLGAYLDSLLSTPECFDNEYVHAFLRLDCCHTAPLNRLESEIERQKKDIQRMVNKRLKQNRPDGARSLAGSMGSGGMLGRTPNGYHMPFQSTSVGCVEAITSNHNDLERATKPANSRAISLPGGGCMDDDDTFINEFGIKTYEEDLAGPIPVQAGRTTPTMSGASASGASFKDRADFLETQLVEMQRKYSRLKRTLAAQLKTPKGALGSNGSLKNKSIVEANMEIEEDILLS